MRSLALTQEEVCVTVVWKEAINAQSLVGNGGEGGTNVHGGTGRCS